MRHKPIAARPAHGPKRLCLGVRQIEMGPRLWCLLAAATFCIPVHAASAQDLSPGLYVRISYDCQAASSKPQVLTSCRRIKGPLAAVTTDSLYLAGGSAGVLRGSIQTLEVRTRGSRRWVGAGLGFLAGTALGVGMAFAAASSCDSSGSLYVDCVALLAIIPVGSLIGIVSGVSIGGGERWQRVPLDVPGNGYVRPAAPFRFGLKVAF